MIVVNLRERRRRVRVIPKRKRLLDHERAVALVLDHHQHALDGLHGGWSPRDCQSMGGFRVLRLAGSVEPPVRCVSIARATSRPSPIAQTTIDCPMRASPAANT